MRIRLLIYLLILFNYNQLFAQEIINEKGYLITKDTLIETNAVFDYFRQEIDSFVFFLYSGFLMPCDSLSFTGKNDYVIKITNPQRGYLEVFFKDRLLYKYFLFKNEVTAVGFCFYPFSGNVAIQGQFKKGLLDGLVFVHNENGEIREVMRYKKGKYVKHIYHKWCFTKRCIRELSKDRSSNPLRMDEPTVM